MPHANRPSSAAEFRHVASAAGSDVSREIQSVIEMIPVGLLMFGADGALRACNDAAARLLNAPAKLLERGVKLEELEDHLVRNLRGAGNDAAARPPALRDLVEGRSGQQVEYRLPDARTMLACGAPFGGGGGIVTLTDVSMQVMSDERARRGQTMRALGDMAGGVAHHFNTLLTTIIGFSHMALSKPDEATRVTECLGEVLTAADRAAELTRDMLVFGREGVCERESFDLGAALHAMAPILHAYADGSVELCLEIGGDPMPVELDRTHLSQSVVALVKRARQAMPDGGCVRVCCHPLVLSEAVRCSHGDELTPGRYARVTVADSGKGLCPEERERLFEPFADMTDPTTTSDAIGLARVYGLVRTFGGAVDVVSGTGIGTTVTLFLPTPDSEAPSPELPASAALPSKPVILIAEDNPYVLRFVETALNDSGYEVVTAPDGSAAIAAFQAHRDRVALLVTDVVMPGMSGVQLADRLQDEMPDLSVIYMSGHTPGELGTTEALADGVVFALKPFEPDTLERLVRESLS